ncbi:MAG: hypothetical protein JNL67_16405 [Planctomycetaceae bacterium]|nr:hypothetical protein [Planctomycetaceae bacterium]
MTDSEYAELESFIDLPLYDDDDPRCSSIDTLPQEPDFEDVREVVEISVAHTTGRQDGMEPQGAIRHWNSDRTKSNIYVYFWRRRQSSF